MVNQRIHKRSERKAAFATWRDIYQAKGIPMLVRPLFGRFKDGLVGPAADLLGEVPSLVDVGRSEAMVQRPDTKIC